MVRIEYRYDYLHNDENAKVFTNSILLLNILYMVLGTLMLAAGFYICLDEDFREYTQDLELKKYIAGVAILMIAGVIVMLQSFFGICGAYLKKTGMLRIFFAMLFISFILELTGSIFLITHGVSGSRMDVFLTERFYDLIARYVMDADARRILDRIQEWIGCCGASGVTDYVNWKMDVPYTCYDPLKGNAWYRDGVGYLGCVQAFSIYAERRTGWICGLALFLAFTQIFGMVTSCALIQVKKDFRKKSLGELDK